MTHFSVDPCMEGNLYLSYRFHWNVFINSSQKFFKNKFFHCITMQHSSMLSERVLMPTGSRRRELRNSAKSLRLKSYIWRRTSSSISLLFRSSRLSLLLSFVSFCFQFVLFSVCFVLFFHINMTSTYLKIYFILPKRIFFIWEKT